MLTVCLKFLALTILINIWICSDVYSMTEPVLIKLSPIEKSLISKKIWQNEAGGTIEGLTHWNKNEGFASLGIGHFIWFPKDKKFVFKESFPSLIHYMLDHGIIVPEWLNNRPCPWSNYDEFHNDQNSEKMRVLRRFLTDTLEIQFDFIVLRSQKALLKMMAETNVKERSRLEINYTILTRSPEGMYALIDYTNFKGEGTLSTERYKGEGWGLRDVLLNMNEYHDNETAVLAFSKSAQEILRRRVKNGPPKEARWLSPWLKRVSGYTQALE
ncbi:MAG: hypothetical protein JKY88_15160 [Pseudomonadales bacterium]|nr:hypothetical protein [Pseudomonadales bacterium]